MESDPGRENKKELQNNNELTKQNQIQFASSLFQENITIHTLLESLAQGVIVIDKSLNILLVNSRAEQMFGYSASEVLGKPHDLLVPHRFRGNHQNLCCNISKHQSASHRNRDGSLDSVKTVQFRSMV